MSIQLTQKERSLLEDQKKHEQICIQKYSNYASQATDPQLKEIFTNHANIEQEHLNSINQMLNGQVPAMNQQSGGQQQTQQQQQQQAQMQQMQQMSATNTQSQAFNSPSSDQDLCNDMLMTEKYVSGAYDTAIFEFSNSQMRDALNHIQKEEQQHGDAIFQFMQSNGMYNPQ